MAQVNSGRRPGRTGRATQTREAITQAALQVFSSRGYAEAGVRDIAAIAGVNPALVTRYFGSKLGLFEAVLEANLDGRLFTSIPRAEFGERLASAFCASGRDAASAVPMLIFAASDSAAAACALKLLRRIVIGPLDEWFATQDAAERSAQMLAVVTGFFVYRLMLPLPPLEQDVSASMRDWLAKTLQEIVDR